LAEFGHTAGQKNNIIRVHEKGSMFSGNRYAEVSIFQLIRKAIDEARV